MSNSVSVKQILRHRLATKGETVTATNFPNSHLLEMDGADLTFEHCDFSYSVIERSYFRNAKFIRCNFIGAKFIDSNFRSVLFDRCDFRYVSVNRTILPVQQVLKSLPEWPNVRRELLQQLRANCVSLGETSLLNVLIEKELEAERDHWRLRSLS